MSRASQLGVLLLAVLAVLATCDDASSASAGSANTNGAAATTDSVASAIAAASSSASAVASAIGFIPSDCPSGPSGLTTSVTASTGTNVYGQNYISGTVVIKNGGNADVPVSKVAVQLANSVPVAPLFTSADCPLDYVPWNPQPWQYGTLTCFFTVTVPSQGIASSPSVWVSAMAIATLGNGAACPKATAPITQQQAAPVYPVLYGRKLKMAA